MGELINFCLNDGDKEFIRITRNGAIWTNDKNIGCHVIKHL